MNEISKLAPESVWKIFEMISEVPRGSGNERAVMDRIAGWARERGLPTKRDATGNMLLSIPPSSGRESIPPILLQGHVDMVCEKNAAIVHDFGKDPIRPRIDGEWVRAEGTTLGADNGIGVAMALAVGVDPSVAHGPVEVLLTVDEETGLTGAAGVQPGFFTAKRMINLDSEEDDGIFVGCAGGRDTLLLLRAGSEGLPGDVAVRRLFVSGLNGGHSGLDINRNRGNAIKILARVLLVASGESAIRIASISGGSKRNAIPREAAAIVVLEPGAAAAFEQRARETIDRIRREELAGADDGLGITIAPATQPKDAFSAEGTRDLLDLIGAIPSGVIAMSQSIPGLVETSTNLGVVETVGDSVRIHCASRSSVMGSLDAAVLQHGCIARLAGAECDQPRGYPGWSPNLESHLLAVARRAYAKTFAREPEVKSIHAGLEAGLLTEKYPELDIVSFGPTIIGAHSPDERVNVPSVQKVWKFLGVVLDDLS